MLPLTTIICDRLQQLERETTKASATDHELEQLEQINHKAGTFAVDSHHSDDNETAATEDCCRSLSSSLSLASSPSFARIKTPGATKKKKTVRFATKATVRPIRRLSLDTHGHLWHSDAEKSINEQEMLKYVKNFRRKSPQEQQECISRDCYMRGLEQFASASLQRELREERKALMLAVLKTQDGQRKQPAKHHLGIEAQTKSNTADENALDLALVSAALSLKARKRALALGLQDAEDHNM